VRYATAVLICLLTFATATATTVAATLPGRGSAAAHAAGDEASAAVRALRHQIRVTRGLALRDAFAAALPAPPHGHAERRAATIPELVPILVRWQGRLTHYRAAYARREPTLQGFACIHRYEGPWNAVSDSDPTYYGGLQMDRTFEVDYGDGVLSTHGGRDANAWSAHDQLMVAMRAYRATGYAPWPNTAAACGLL
jgi:hypothetical protein